MKPLLLEIQAFGPYVEKQTIDFEKLSREGIFLIKGKTGSGKTTIFDAMTFALYGGGSGTEEKSKTGRNDFAEWRCNQAPDNLETIVSFIFASRGKKYRFARKFGLKRTNFSVECEAGEIDKNGNVIPFFNNPKATDLKAKAEEIIGLTKDQFRQVVLLPQGQFERFLTASADEKSVILNKIFDADKWKSYAQKFFETANEKKNALDNEKAAIDSSLSDEGVLSIEELESKIVGLNAKLKKCQEEHKGFDGTKKQEGLNRDIAISKEFESLHKLHIEKGKLQQRSEEIKEKEETYSNAESAENVRPYIDKFEETKKDFDDRSTDLSEKEKQKPSTKNNYDEAKKALEEHEKNSPIAELNAKKVEYESKIKAYSSFDDLEKAFTSAKEAYETAKGEFDDADQTLTDLTQKAAALYTEYDSANETAAEYRSRYYKGIYGEIAASLKEGEACPVCGSKDHPATAERLPDSISKSEMEEKEKAAKNAKKAWEDAESNRKTAEKEQVNKKDALDKKKTAKNDEKAKLNAAKESLIEGIADIQALENAINSIGGEIVTYNNKTEELRDARDKAKEALTTLNTEIETAGREKAKAKTAFEDAKTDLEEVLKDNGYADAETAKDALLDAELREQLHTEITEYKRDCETNADNLSSKEKELEGKVEPDSSKFDDRQKEITGEAEAYSENRGSLTREINRLNDKYTNLSKKYEHYKKYSKSAENDLSFARKLRGDTGIGLQRYVLAIMFNQVIGEANEMLKKIHGGRYTLFRTDDKGNGNKRGLELKVHDNRSPEKEGRSVSMLSGGEKFLVSLALSIGMSTVAQKAGVHIDALFIDEGFGTLDENSIADAMDVLDCVRKANSMIGIISHVELLAENIPMQLEVIKNDAGNSIKAV